ncbi:hypothetical protein NBH00_24600 [Paraconexibacter antarcticus]|uniref:Uncharacterized protein n=1 Tax=Paraconexibacter antarcticus TaxID=2949664 RepID=A0ABY5DSC4_9ACTN|nr:hypothetical protein [Paraconexibacter antarcticus]UTI64504.1 hypothetical protein NBH00_24600 [Paraconexibacter antarcticus]
MTIRLVPAPPRTTTPRRRPASRSAAAATPAAPGVLPGDVFTFLDLVAGAGPRARPSQLMDWLADALSSGRAVPLGYATGTDGQPAGPRRYRLL